MIQASYQSSGTSVSGVVYAATGGSYTAVLQDLETVAGDISSSGLTQAQYNALQNDFQTICQIDGAYSYVPSVFGSMLQSGIAVGTSASDFNAQLGKWFLGTDRPTPLMDDTLVDKSRNTLFPSNISTAYNHIDQGWNNGDCYLIAALVETAAINPVLLQNMITANGNGTYAVQFYSP